MSFERKFMGIKMHLSFNKLEQKGVFNYSLNALNLLGKEKENVRAFTIELCFR